MMDKQSDSFEGDIWNYQPAARKREKSSSIQSASDASCRKVHNKSSVQQDKFSREVRHSSSYEGPSQRKFTAVAKHDSDSNEEQLDEQIIDVNSESDSESSSLKGQTGDSKHHLNTSSQMAEKNGLQDVCHSSASNIKQSLSSTSLSRSPKKVMRKRSFQCQSKSKANSNRPAQKLRRLSESEEIQSKALPSIKTYFSPKKMGSRTENVVAKISDDPIILSDDEFATSQHMKVSGYENESTMDAAANITKIDFGKEHTKARAELCKGIVETSQSYLEDEMDNCGVKSSQSCQQTPLVDVDVICDEESEQSSFETECRSALLLREAVFNQNQSGLVLHDLGNGSDSKNDTTSGDHTSIIKAEENKGDTIVAFNKIVKKSHTSDVESKASDDNQSSNFNTECGGFFLEENNMNAEECFNEKEEIHNNVEINLKDAALSDREEEEKPEKFKTKPEDAIDISNKELPSLLSSASWPSASTAATKQTTLFSFLKAKPGARTLNANADSHSVLSRQTCRKSSSASSVASSSAATKLNQNPSNMFDSSYTYEENFKGDGKKKACPFYKRIPGTSITVDAFRYGVIPGCEAYVLTHFHYDHYGGLTKKFSQPIFCSQVTGNLVESRIGVDKKWINYLPMWKPCKVAGITLTLMEANHCPGAVIILFELNNGKKILHTGDFRASPEMETYSALQGIRISELYLDTTYCNPSYAFPDQSKVVHFVVDLVLKHIADHPSTLIVCGAYTIGKERIFAAIAKSLNSKICVMNDKKKVLDCLEDEDLKSRVTLDWSAGRVHVLPMGKLNQQQLKEHHARHPHFKSVLAFQPTGWTHSDKQTSLHNLKPKWSKDGITLYGVPYSEHSSFLELKRFVQHFRPLKILPTVNNGSPASRSKMEAIFKEWMSEKK